MKIAIVTIVDYGNYGNRLQNYALQKSLENLGLEVCTLNTTDKLAPGKCSCYIKNTIVHVLKIIARKRYRKFYLFSKKIRKTGRLIDITESLERLNSVYDYFIVGSDQVWNPLYGRLSNVDLLTGVANEKRVSYAASFGIENLPEEYRDKVEKELLQFRKISVREDIGKKIVEDITGRTDISVLIDPTMLLTADYWSKIVKRPGFHSEDKYVLLFFLGGVSSQNKEIIKNYAKQNNCKIINLLDKKSKYYSCDPSEFLFMEKNAQMVCTDSFHSTVFSILFNSSFTVFERISDNNMNSRLETLLEKFGLQSRVFMGEETLNNQTYDWENVNMKLNVEREYSFQYLKSALNIKG